MSPTVNNFVHDLVAMAKAMEDLPQVQAQLDFVRGEHDKALMTIQSREETIQRLKSEIETHLATIRRLEVDRDNAETMFLELDEKTHSVMAKVKNAMDQLDQGLTILDPPKPIPPVTSEQVSEVIEVMQGQSADPLSSVNTTEHKDTAADNTVTTQVDVSTQTEPVTTASAEPGVSVEPLPTAQDRLDNDGGPVASTGAETTPNVSQPETNSISNVSADPGPAIGAPPVDDVGYHNEPDYFLWQSRN